MKFSMFNKISTSAIRCVSLLLTLLVFGVSSILADGCYVLDLAGNPSNGNNPYELNTIETGPSFKLSGPGAQLSYDARRQTAAAGYFFVQYSTNGSDFYDLSNPDLSTSFKTYGPIDLPEGTTHIRFITKGGATLTKYYKNIKVTRKTWLKADTVRFAKTKAEMKEGVLVLDYSSANSGDIHIDNDNPKFVLSRTTISGSCATDTAHIAVQYRSDVIGRDTAHIVIRNNTCRIETALVGETYLGNQTGSWKENLGLQTVGAWIFNAFTSTLSSANGVTYSSSNSSVIKVCGDTLKAVGTGETTLTARVEGDDTYNSIESSITITVTNQIAQYINWNQNFQNLLMGDDDIVLLASASSDSTMCTTNGLRSIAYSIKSGTNAVVEIISDSKYKLRIKGVGQDTIVATQIGGVDADGHDYVAVTMEKPVNVRYADGSCGDDTYLYDFNDSTQLIDGERDGIRDEYRPETNETIIFERNKLRSTCSFTKAPGYATWYYKRDEKGAGVLFVEQYIPECGWTSAKNITTFSTNWATDTILLSHRATQARIGVSRTGEDGNLYFGGFKVKLARYIEVEENKAVTNQLMFESYVGTPQIKSLRVNYSDIHDIMTLVLSDGAPFILSTTEIVDACGNTGSVDITLTYKPTAEETNAEYTLTLSDGTTTTVVTLNATASSEVCILASSDNWSEGEWSILPTSSREAIIDNNVEVVVDKKVEVYKLTLRSGAKVTIAPTGGLTVGAGGIDGATTTDRIYLQADSTGKTGFLRISPDYVGAMPKATIELFSVAFTDNVKRTSTWQYMGIPVDGDVIGWDFCDYGEQFVYGWKEEIGGWFDSFGEELKPFNGYCITQNNDPKGKKFTFEGTLVDSRVPAEVNLTYTSSISEDVKGCHIIANSFTAPIDISKLTAEDFGGATATVYMFNTGSQDEAKENAGKYDNSNTRGQYIAVTPGTAATLHRVDGTFPVVIPSMQGFYIRTEGAATLNLDYRKLVWNADYSEHSNEPMRIVGRGATEENEEDQTSVLKMTISDGNAADNLYLLASDRFEKIYENGSDAPKRMSDDANLPSIFAVEDDNILAIDATSNFDGTSIGVRTGKETAYTLAFTNLSNVQDLVLHDAELDQDIEIFEGAEYTFFAVPNSLITDRFSITESGSGNTPGVTTDCENVNSGAKVQKFIQNGQMFVLKNGVLYNAQGLRVR